MKYYRKIKILKKYIYRVNYSKLKKDNNITSTGLSFLKESLKQNQFLKKISFWSIKII
jgi:hypothetical protein